jgi:hypothetical protein
MEYDVEILEYLELSERPGFERLAKLAEVMDLNSGRTQLRGIPLPEPERLDALVAAALSYGALRWLQFLPATLLPVYGISKPGIYQVVFQTHSADIRGEGPKPWVALTRALLEAHRG